MSNYTQEKEIRTTHFTLDRTGTVCRFLRLAFRVNMEQEKLALRMAKEGDAPAAPLTDEELSEQARQAALDAAEMSAGTLRVREREPVDSTDPVGWAEPTTSPDQDLVTSVPPGDARTRGSSLGDSPTTSSDQPDPKLDHPGPTLNPEPRTLNPGAHNAHNADPLQIAASTAKPCTCVVEIGSKKNSHARTTDAHQPRHKEMKASNQTRLGSHSRRAKAIK